MTDETHCTKELGEMKLQDYVRSKCNRGNWRRRKLELWRHHKEDRDLWAARMLQEHTTQICAWYSAADVWADRSRGIWNLWSFQ